MSSVGAYLYGFTGHQFRPAGDLRGLAGAPIQVITFRDVAAVVSAHPVQHLMPLRSNLEPHHRIVRHVSTHATLVPAAFGHISDTPESMLAVLQDNYADIRSELKRLDAKCEMGLKLCWKTDSIFEFLVRQDSALRDLRDRTFRNRQPSLNEKLQVGSLFDATLNRERERLTGLVLGALRGVAWDVLWTPPRTETTVCQGAVLIERARDAEFVQALQTSAALLGASFTIDYSGPLPVYSFVRLRLQSAKPTVAA